jgi:hypothetical protein
LIYDRGMRFRVRRCWLLVGLLGLAFAAAPSAAEACSPPAPLAPVGLPRSGTTSVSTATSLIVFARGTPTGYTLQAAGQDVPISDFVVLGGGADGMRGPATFWQIRLADGMLVPGAEHVLTATFQGAPVEVTRFTTASGYDKVQGTPPVINAVHLWRVRYPVADIGSGNCVFAEYHGFITVDYVPGTVPNTAPSSVVHAFLLRPKTGGSDESFVYTGDTPFTGTEPTGAYPLPIGAWQPELDPTRSYCLTVSAFGDGDLARGQVFGEPVCTDVVQRSAAGAPPPPQIGGGGTGGGGGCAVAGSAGGGFAV